MATDDVAAGHDAEAFARLERRLARLEASVDRLVGVLDQAGPAVAMGLDVVDDEAARLAARGVDLDARMRRVGGLVEALSEPRTLDALERLVDVAVAAEPALSGASGTAGMVLDIVDAELAALTRDGVDVDAAVRQLFGVLRHLGDPAVGRLIDSAAANAEVLEGAIGLAAQAPDVTAMVLDIVDDVLAEAGADGVDLGLLVPRVHAATKAGVAFATSDGFHAFAEAMAEPDAFGHLVPLIRAIRDATREPPEPVGLWGVLGRLSDPKVQSATGLFFQFLTAVGDAHDAHHALPGPTGRPPEVP